MPMQSTFSSGMLSASTGEPQVPHFKNNHQVQFRYRPGEKKKWNSPGRADAFCFGVPAQGLYNRISDAGDWHGFPGNSQSARTHSPRSNWYLVRRFFEKKIGLTDGLQEVMAECYPRFEVCLGPLLIISQPKWTLDFKVEGSGPWGVPEIPHLDCRVLSQSGPCHSAAAAAPPWLLSGAWQLSMAICGLRPFARVKDMQGMPWPAMPRHSLSNGRSAGHPLLAAWGLGCHRKACAKPTVSQALTAACASGCNSGGRELRCTAGSVRLQAQAPGRARRAASLRR